MWREHRDRTYRDPGGDPSPNPGALQIVFCDLSTPTGPGWNAYRELRDQLAARGVPAEQIRWIHEARNDAEKARLFAACRTGQVAVIVGSTPRMGIGTNIQDRAIALHHLDCPWRPADIEQRDGRGLRQGNQNPEIRLFRYAVEGSFDSYSWQTVERKARFINQVMSGQLDQRQVDDIGDNALSYSEVKALASGDPLILDKARADADHARLSRLHRAWQRNQQTLRHTLADATDQADDYAQRANAVADAIARCREIRGDAFHMTVDGHTADARPVAAELIARWATINQHVAAIRPLPLGQLAGLDLDARVRHDPTNGQRTLTIALRNVSAAAPAELPLNAVTQDASPLIRQLEHRVRDLPALAQRLTTRRQDALSEAAAARHALTQPFKYAAELDQAAATRAEITEQIKARHEKAHDHDTTPDAGEEASHQRQALDAAQARRLATAAFPSPAPNSGHSRSVDARHVAPARRSTAPAASRTTETLTMRHGPLVSRVG